MELDFLGRVASAVDVPVIAGGGAGTPEHVREAMDGGADAVAVASILHYGTSSIGAIKARLVEGGLPVRSSA
jgi:cyclase